MRRLSFVAGALRSFSWWQVVLLGAILVLDLSCASSSPFNQKFVEVRTANFLLTSSLSDEATRELARELEFFHAGAVHSMGVDPTPVPHLRTRVFAFDDRSLSRPFAVRGAPSYVMPAVDGSVWVFRAGGDFSERAMPDIKHRYAHRILRDRSAPAMPLWLEEGNARVAGVVDVKSQGARVGLMDPERRAFLLDWRRADFVRAFRVTDVSSDSLRDRELFESQAWAVVHTLRFGASGRGDAADERKSLNLVDRAAGDRAIERLAARGEALAERIYEVLEDDKQRVGLVGVRKWRSQSLELKPLSREEARSRLGGLALQLARPGLAREYFDRALQADAEHAFSHAGLAVVAAREGEPEALRAHLERAMSNGSELAAVRQLCGDAHREQAASVPEADRGPALEEARDHYRAVLRLEPTSASARLGMGATYLLDGGDPERATEWFEAVRRLHPGSLDLQLWMARVEQSAGRSRAARIRAKDIISRSHWPDLDRRARALIEETEATGLR